MDLITKYKNKIADLQRKQKVYEASGRAGACISLQGEIQAYNSIIKDLERIKSKNKHHPKNNDLEREQDTGHCNWDYLEIE